MSIRKRSLKPLYVFLLALGILIIAVLPAAAKWNESSPAQQIQQGWDRAKAIGRFHFQTNTVQTKHPTPNAANIGRGAITERFDLQGNLDSAAQELELQIWPKGRQLGQSMTLKVADGKTLGRTGSAGEWTEVPEAADLFIQNGDPLGYLSAAENVRQIPDASADSLFPGQLLPEKLDREITRYRFNLNGLQYAQFMQAALEEHLRRSGELPAGISLGLVQKYVDMQGEGELWLDANGLPYRQIVHLQFPAGENDLQWVEAQITTDYSAWNPRAADLRNLDWSQPTTAVSSLLLLNGLNPRDVSFTLYKLGLVLLILGAAALLFQPRFSRPLRLAFSLVIILSMLAGPLLQVQQAAAFNTRQEARAAQNAPAANAGSPEANTAVFQPHTNPLAAQRRTPALAQPQRTASTAAAPNLVDPIRQAKASACTVGESSDCDNDGLDDKVEIFELGTFTDDVDTDNDGISDNIEVVGFSVGGETWYMDPRNPDSNGDGLPDGLECSARHNINADGSIDSSVTATTCADTDKDGVPDVWDFDNDKDGVPDTVDNDPQTSHAVVDQQFGLTLAGYETEKPLFVDITIRPTNEQHLWWTNNYLDWPDLDQHGQIMRVTTETLGTDGDIMLSPVLEITIPFNSANPSRSLPVKSGVSVSGIKATTPIADWLDTDTLDLYSMVVHQDTNDGTLVVYAPLNLTNDVFGQTPVAWSAHLYYKMASASSGWGHDHEMKVLWTVNGINDQCSVPEGETWSSYCDVGSQRENTTNLSHWTSANSILQTYYDDFTVTALTVLEEQKIDAAVIAQKQGASGGSSHYENYLWHTAETLEETFLAAQLYNGSRMSVADIGTHYSNWGIPSAALYFQHYQNLADSTALHNELSGDNVITLLNTIYSGSSKPTYANLLFVGDKTFRSIGLDLESTLVQLNEADSYITMDLSGITATTTGFMRLSPYTHNGATWVNTDLDTYLEVLDSGLGSVFTSGAVQQLVGSESGYDFSQAQDGAVSLAKNYYTSLFSGAVTFLQDGSTVLSNGTLNNNLHGMPSEPVVTIVGELLDNIQDFYTRISLSNLTLTATLYTQLEAVATSAWVALANSRSQVLEALGQVVGGSISTSNSMALKQLQWAPLISGDLSSLLNAGALDYTYRSSIGEALYYGTTTTTLALIYYSLRGVYKIYSAYKYFTGAVGKVSSLLQGIIEDYSTQLWLGYALVVGAAVASFVFAWATGQITPGSPEFAEKLAYEISTIIVATVVLVVLTVATGGIILGVLAVIAVIDAVAAIICAAVGVKPGSDVDQWVCGGLTGALVKALTYVINDYTPLVDFTHSGRLDNSMSTPTITQKTGTPGFAVGNAVNLTTTITSTLYFGHPNWMGYAYADTQLTDDVLKETTFKYELQKTPTDIPLNLNGTSWNFIGSNDSDSSGIPTGPRYRQNFEAPIAYTFADSEAGVNVGLGIYLAEGFAMNAQDCWLILGDPACWLETYKDTNQTDLSSDIIFDIFPETLDGFHDLALVGSNSYKQSWDGSFPTLIDGDGDGLTSKAAGGVDPDDSSPDTDGDGLNDYFEVTNNFDPTSADGDKDGLTDYWEVFYLTDPTEADSDGDGLLDSQEAFHPNWIYPYENSILSDNNPPPNAPSQSNYAGGWEIVYAFNGSTPLKTWVSADPNDPDSDDDSINDLREEVYGYNPLAASTLQVLGLHSEVQASEGSTTYPVPYATLTSQIGYTAVISNELTDRWALGLLQTEYPVDQVQATKELGVLQPLGTTSLSGSVSASDSGLSASGTTSMTVRAGAIIEGDDNRVLWLRMNEASGASAFTDSSPYDHEVKCTACPSANGSYLTFSPTSGSMQELLVVPSEAMTAADFTLGMWVNVTTPGIVNLFNFETIAGGRGSTDFSLDLSNSAINLVVEKNSYTTNQTISTGKWTHLLVTYDQSSKKATLYINGIQKWQQTTATIIYGDLAFDIAVGAGNAGTRFALDDLEFFDRVLDTTEIEQLFGSPILDIDFDKLEDTSPSANSLSCTSGSTCPATSTAGASFSQNQFVKATGSALNFSGDAFTISTWIKPEKRPIPFDTDAVSASNGLTGAPPRVADTNYDWQAVFGGVDASNPKKVAPSLFVNPKGQMRMFMGNGSTTCYVDTAAGLVNYGSWQHVTVSYDGQVFTFYINGQKAAVSTNDCGAVTPSNLGLLEVGRAAESAVIYFKNVHFTKGDDGGGVYELRVNLDGNGSAYNIWSKGGVTDSSNHTESINFAYYLASGSHNFRFWEDDSSPNNNDYHECYKFCDDSLVYKTVTETAVSPTGSSFDYQETDVDYSEGTLYWSVSNDFFQGTIDGFKAYTRAFSDEDALKLFEASYDGLYFPFDEPPGANSFVDGYDDNVAATCDYNAGTCPDSGIGGIDNQAAHFQDGIDYLQLSDNDLLKTLDSNFTIAAWIKPDTVSGRMRILAAGRDSSINGFGFGLSGNKLLFTTFGIKDYVSNAEVSAGIWQHVAVVFDSTYAASFYVNGQFVDKVTGTKKANSNTDDPYRIGSTTDQNGAATSEPFTGLIDELFVEARALDPYGIQRLMQNAPVLNLHLDEDLFTEAFVNEVGISSFAYCESTTACPGAGDKGQIRESAVFDGVDDILSADIYPFFSPTFGGLPEFTVGLWVNPSEIKDDYQPLVALEGPTGGDRNFGLFIHPGSMDVHMSMSNSACSAYIAKTAFNNPLLQHQWNHVMFTFDGSVQRLYINGTQRTANSTSDGPCLSTYPVKIGNELNKFTPFSGGIDEVTVRGRALSDFEVADIFAYQSSWFDVKETHTVTIDDDNPTVSIDRESLYLAPGDHIIKIAAQDPTSEIVKVDYAISGWTGELHATNTNGVWTFPFSLPYEGDYGIVLAAWDSVGHTGDSINKLIVDLQPPSGSASSPPNKPTNGVMTWDSIKVTDDGATIADANSGVNPNSIMVTVRDRHGAIVGAPVQATATCNSGATSCTATAAIPFTFDPYGSYTFAVSFTDNVGNLGGFTQDVVLDARPPHAEVLLHASTTITAGMTLKGVAGDVEHIWHSRALALHFEQPADTVTFIDPSPNEFLATCDLRGKPDGSPLPPGLQAQCPTAGVSGKYVNGLSLDGIDDRLVLLDSVGVSATESITAEVEARLGLYHNSFTVMAWVNASDWSGDRAILGTDPTQDSQALFFGFKDGKPDLGYGGSSLSASQALPTGTWKHVTWRYDNDTAEQSIFVDGTLVASQANADPYSGLLNTIYIGRAADSAFYSGLLDELVAYPVALTDDIIYDIGNPVDSGMDNVQIRFRKYDDSGQPVDSGTWYDTTFTSGTQDDIFRTWEFEVPAGMNGSYKIDLQSTDNFGDQGSAVNSAAPGTKLPGNQRYVPGVWSGRVGFAEKKTFFFPVIPLRGP